MYVARYKNITSAAQHLYVSQPTLSRHIMALEDELGVKLFERNNKQMQLTRAGQAFYNDSESLAKHMQTVIDNVQAVNGGSTGILRVTLPLVLHDVLDAPLSDMRSQYPLVNIVLESFIFNEIPNAIHHNLYDVGLTYDYAFFHDEIEVFEDLGILPLRRERFCLVVPSKYSASCAKDAILNMGNHLPLILPSYIEPPFLKQLLSELQRYLPGKTIYSYALNTPESVIMNVASELGYSVASESLANFPPISRGVAFIGLPEIPQAMCTVVLIYRKTGATQPAENFIKLAKHRAISTH
jgi:DNA-binding transcriptional LysR family regulator